MKIHRKVYNYYEGLCGTLPDGVLERLDHSHEYIFHFFHWAILGIQCKINIIAAVTIENTSRREVVYQLYYYQKVSFGALSIFFCDLDSSCRSCQVPVTGLYLENTSR